MTQQGKNGKGMWVCLQVYGKKNDLEYNHFTTVSNVCVEKATRPELMELLEEAGIPKEQIVSWEY